MFVFGGHPYGRRRISIEIDAQSRTQIPPPQKKARRKECTTIWLELKRLFYTLDDFFLARHFACTRDSGTPGLILKLYGRSTAESYSSIARASICYDTEIACAGALTLKLSLAQHSAMQQSDTELLAPALCRQ